MGQHPSTAGPGGGGMGAAIAGGDEASKPLLAEDNFEETQQQSRLQNNEDQIMQRDKAIQDIESTVADVAEIMQDLAVVVHSQDDLIDNIESAVDRTVDQTKAANTELVKVRCPCPRLPVAPVTLEPRLTLLWLSRAGGGLPEEVEEDCVLHIPDLGCRGWGHHRLRCYQGQVSDALIKTPTCRPDFSPVSSS